MKKKMILKIGAIVTAVLILGMSVSPMITLANTTNAQVQREISQKTVKLFRQMHQLLEQ
ncbi:hypothetical protein [Lactococcus lactis]|uniref:hypothetical protein n=1 Tax=Lactococcus lactis TaxID=1358 RepID=UPI00223B57A0|nr:hypothetical protein [Lactococcus lactis]